MASPSEPLLEKLRQLSTERGMKTAALAQAAGLDRQRVRKVLTGQEPMTVDELIAITNALELGPEEMAEMATDPSPAPARNVDAAVTIASVLDPYGNHSQQMFEVAFALGCDFFFTASTSNLTDDHVPDAILSQYKNRDLPIKLDAAYHQYNNPIYSATGVTLTLSFDALYECTFPWTAIKQVIMFPLPPTPEADPEPEPEEDEPAPARPSFLRLVE